MEVKVKNPRLVSAYSGRALARQASGDLAGAIADYDSAISIFPNLAMPHMDRGLALLARAEQAEADREFQRCLALDAKLKSLLEKRVEKLKQDHAAAQKRPTAWE